MAQWQTVLQVARPSVGKAVAGLGLIALLAELSHPPCPLDGLLNSAAGFVLRVLPSLVAEAWQAVQGFGCEHVHLWAGISQISATGWLALLKFAATA